MQTVTSRRSHRSQRPLTAAPTRASSLDDFLDQLGTVDLLKPEQEISLAQRIEAGREAQVELERSGSEGSLDRLRALRRQIRDGEEARAHFVSANLRLVVHLAGRHPRSRGASLEDLIQDGTIGLVRAVDKFDWRRGFRFSTYATWWIRDALQRGHAAEDRTIALPLALRESARKVAAARARLEATHGHEPDLEEIAEATSLTPDRVKTVLETPADAVSLDAGAGGDDGSSLAELVAVADDDHAEDVTERLARRGAVAACASRLDDRAWRVLELRYGLDGRGPRTYEAVADELSVCKETVRLTLRRAFQQLREDPELEALAS